MEVLKEMPRRDPINGTFELTVRCNLKCKMCLFRHDDSENKEIMANEMTAKEWIDMASQVAEAGTLHILITGGEPMLRPDFCEIYEGIYKQGFMITLYTNATLVTPKIIETLKKYPPHRIGVTIYGASEETYEKVCGNGKAFNRTLEAIDVLSQLPSNLEFRTTIIKDNIKDLTKMEDIIKNKFNGKYILTHSTEVHKPVRGGIADVEKYRLTPKENIELYMERNLHAVQNLAIKKGISPDSIKLIKKDKNLEVSNNFVEDKKISIFGCEAGMNSYTISWDGKLLGCQLLGNFYTEPLKYGFKSEWNRYPFTVKIPDLNNKCRNCEQAKDCFTCYAVRYAETGDLGGCPEYTCEEVSELLNKIYI